jgi:hemerythrin-like metal-binding protein
MSDIVPEKQIRWLPDYAVGVQEIDREHQGLFSIAEEFRFAIRAEEGADVLENLLGKLLAYTDYHFAHEENLMEQIGYPYLADHCRQHQDLRSEALAMQERVAIGEPEMAMEAMRFLVDWLKRHTTTSDRRIGSYMRKHGLST